MAILGPGACAVRKCCTINRGIAIDYCPTAKLPLIAVRDKRRGRKVAGLIR
ncbi:hypothetical protein PGR6_15290 [Pseudomonas sp. GR 6-02]|nr:hypothetical protein PGR6_15290 [Pseudomonas sp. GR 6-02]